MAVGNNVNHNPIFVDTPMLAAEVTRDVYITGFYWTGLTATDAVSVQDNCATPKQIWKAVASADGLDVQFTPEQPIPANGIKVNAITDGTILLIYLKSRV